jgi:hypothetical protein
MTPLVAGSQASSVQRSPTSKQRESTVASTSPAATCRPLAGTNSGFRMALGAPRRSVIWLALRDSANVAAFGAAAGIPLALLLAWRLRDLLYSTAPYDPLTLGVVLGALLVVVFVASLAPARRATLVDPATAMRAD